MFKSLIPALAVAAALALPVAAAAGETATTAPETAPAFTLMSQEGKPVSLADYAGRIVVLEWTNYECPFVKHHGAAGTMKALAGRWREQGVVWLAVNSTKHATRELDAAWIASNALPYPILEDFDGKVGRAYGARTTPHIFIVGKDGKLAYRGAIDDDRRLAGKPSVNYVEQALAELTAGRPVSQPATEPYGCSVKYRE